MSARDELARVVREEIQKYPTTGFTPFTGAFGWGATEWTVADAILASDWLARHDAKKLEELADDWEKMPDHILRTPKTVAGSLRLSAYRIRSAAGIEEIGPEPIKSYSHDDQEWGYEGDG